MSGGPVCSFFILRRAKSASWRVVRATERGPFVPAHLWVRANERGPVVSFFAGRLRNEHPGEARSFALNGEGK